MQKKILSQFVLTTWSNGEITLEPYKISNSFSDFDLTNENYNKNCYSSRIFQSLEVIRHTLQKLKSISNVDVEIINHSIIKSIDIVAEQAGVKTNTIRDKITRQLEVSQSQFAELLWKYYTSNGKNVELKNLLLEKVGQNTRIDDMNLIHTTFDQFFKVYF